MLKLSQIIQTEYENEYGNEYSMKENISYTKPKIYHGGWDLSKRWYVYFSFRNAITGKMERQPPVYWIVNKFKTIPERKKAVTRLREILEKLLENNQVPTKYKNTELLLSKFISINDAIDRSIKNAEQRMAESSYTDYRQRLKKFEKWLTENHLYGKDVSEIDKKIVTTYLNSVLESTSPKNRNNTRANLSIFFSFLVDNEFIESNFVSSIPVLPAKPRRNKSYTTSQEADIIQLVEEQNPHLLLFIKFVSYNFLRNIEVCRLQIKDIDFENSTQVVDAKNQLRKTKIIPKLLMQEIIQFKNMNPDFYLFSSSGVGFSEVSAMQRRSYWGKQFNKIKTQLKLEKDYTIYSFRHTYITKLYREFRAEFTPFETKSRLMLITGHSSMAALEKYLRDIDAELPEDYSHLL